jgi:hypothetical protein
MIYKHYIKNITVFFSFDRTVSFGNINGLTDTINMYIIFHLEMSVTIAKKGTY